MTDAARLHLDPDLAARRFDDCFVDELEGTLGLFDTNGFHVCLRGSGSQVLLELRPFIN